MLMFWMKLISPSSGSALEMAGLYKTLVVVYQTTWHDIPQHGNPEKKWGSESQMESEAGHQTKIKQMMIQVFNDMLEDILTLP